jgi:hypothetical protein
MTDNGQVEPREMLVEISEESRYSRPVPYPRGRPTEESLPGSVAGSVPVP